MNKAPVTFQLQGLHFGAPRRVRIPNLLIRSQVLYPVELWAQVAGWAARDAQSCCTMNRNPKVLFDRRIKYHKPYWRKKQ